MERGGAGTTPRSAARLWAVVLGLQSLCCPSRNLPPERVFGKSPRAVRLTKPGRPQKARSSASTSISVRVLRGAISPPLRTPPTALNGPCGTGRAGIVRG